MLGCVFYMPKRLREYSMSCHIKKGNEGGFLPWKILAVFLYTARSVTSVGQGLFLFYKRQRPTARHQRTTHNTVHTHITIIAYSCHNCQIAATQFVTMRLSKLSVLSNYQLTGLLISSIILLHLSLSCNSNTFSHEISCGLKSLSVSNSSVILYLLFVA